MKKLEDKLDLTALRKLMAEFESKEILVIGDLMADQSVWGEALRISTEAPVPVLKIMEEKYELGGAANIAKVIKNLKAHVELCGLLGYDNAADFFRTACQRNGINTSGIFPTEDRPTTLKIRIMSQAYQQQMLRLDQESKESLTEREVASLNSFIKVFISDMNAILLADFAKGMFNNESFTQSLLNQASKAGKPVVVHTKATNIHLFNNVNILITHLREAEEYLLMNNFRNLKDPEFIGEKIMETVNTECLILHHDDHGMYRFRRDVPNRHIYENIGKVFDVSGIGDIIAAMITVALAAGADCDTAVNLAWLAATIGLYRVGVAQVTQSDLINALEEKQLHPPETLQE